MYESMRGEERTEGRGASLVVERAGEEAGGEMGGEAIAGSWSVSVILRGTQEDNLSRPISLRTTFAPRACRWRS